MLRRIEESFGMLSEHVHTSLAPILSLFWHRSYNASIPAHSFFSSLFLSFLPHSHPLPQPSLSDIAFTMTRQSERTPHVGESASHLMQMKGSLISKQHSRSILLSYENGRSNILELSTSQCKRSSETVLKLLQLNILLHSCEVHVRVALGAGTMALDGFLNLLSRLTNMGAGRFSKAAGALSLRLRRPARILVLVKAGESSTSRGGTSTALSLRDQT